MLSTLFMVSMPELVQAFGHAGLFVLVFIETGLPIGFVLPGDSVLFTAGLLASQGYLDIWVLAPLLALAAVLGDSVGYWLGAALGPKLFASESNRIFKKSYLTRTEEFYAKYGARAVVLARFVPLVRTFVPFLAGAGSMRYRTFFAYNVLGGLLWGAGLPLAGYFLGAAVPGIDRYVLLIVAVILVVSCLPVVFEYLGARKRAR
jgi:membrane-associated protein